MKPFYECVGLMYEMFKTEYVFYRHELYNSFMEQCELARLNLEQNSAHTVGGRETDTIIEREVQYLKLPQKIPENL